MMQKIREATRLLATNLVLFSSIILTVWLPGSILLVYLRLYVFPEATGGDELRMFTQELRVSNAIEFAFSPLYVGAILYAASRLKQGLQTTYRESMSHGARRSFTLLITRLGAGFIVFFGLIVFIIPGIILALRFALIDSVVVLDNVEGTSARKLSTMITKGKKWNILRTILLTFIGVFLAAFLMGFVLYLPLSFIGQDENFIIAVLSECVVNILLIIPTLVLFLFYWEAKSQQIAPQHEDNQ
ncbi:hypothetical protein IQ249_06555 [Lusitaniella coriacea LEGE 07157]|uniref:Glycerophosphoryl diester phosphodiesterase membrane domain-containing protein n=1 Tax=Lusitaniella coriacea LEGE 07157 TaxID=945747 RepID=A0A8J7DVF3_9CYAN|nr:hypothetical protein [Lusitaniella coriacea]MBE9115556.1 hypothetical protein [Lusitaniella coriacea LEGE 07157]